MANPSFEDEPRRSKGVTTSREGCQDTRRLLKLPPGRRRRHLFLSIILEEKKTVTFNPVCCCSVRL